jgi:hypothetical protein
MIRRQFQGSRLQWVLPAGILLCVFASGCPSDPPVDNESWAEEFDATDVGWLMCAWGPSATEIYAVGGGPDSGVMLRSDGESWERVSGLDGLPLLNWVHGLSSDVMFAVGNDGTALRWDGSTWEPMETPTEEDLWGVWVNAPDDVYAVGGRGLGTSVATVMHFDGATWSVIEMPELERPNVRAFFKVWASGPDDVWVVGQRGAVVRYDGTEWTEQLVGTGDDVISVWGLGPNRVAMAAGRNNGTVVTWDGTSFTAHSLAPLPGLNGVWMRDPNRIHVAGNEGQLGVVDFDTGAVVSDDYQTTRLAFHNIFGDESGGLLAVGGNLNSSGPPYQGIAFRRSLGTGE